MPFPRLNWGRMEHLKFCVLGVPGEHDVITVSFRAIQAKILQGGKKIRNRQPVDYYWVPVSSQTHKSAATS